MEKKKSKYKVFIVDDHPIVRQGLAQLIDQEKDFSICGNAGDISEAMEGLTSMNPDIVIIDISLGHTNGIRLIEDVSGSFPDMLILTLTMHDESIYAERCLRAGARGFVMKQEPPETVITAMRKIIDGEVYVSEKMGAKLLNKLVSKHPDENSSPLELLSNREFEVFQLIGQGMKTKNVAEELNLSVKTVETYIDHIKKKMKFKDSRGLLMHAVQWAMDKDIK